MKVAAAGASTSAHIHAFSSLGLHLLFGPRFFITATAAKENSAASPLRKHATSAP